MTKSMEINKNMSELVICSLCEEDFELSGEDEDCTDYVCGECNIAVNHRKLCQ